MLSNLGSTTQLLGPCNPPHLGSTAHLLGLCNPPTWVLQPIRTPFSSFSTFSGSTSLFLDIAIENPLPNYLWNPDRNIRAVMSTT
jgi:hypothetical protein